MKEENKNNYYGVCPREAVKGRKKHTLSNCIAGISKPADIKKQVNKLSRYTKTICKSYDMRIDYMKATKRLISVAFVFVICFTLAVSVAAYDLTYKGSVLLSADKYSVTSSQYSGNHGRGRIYNLSGSAGNATIALQLSNGSSWTTYTTETAAPGTSLFTNIWGRHDTEYLFRVIVSSSEWYLFGNPGRIAYGYVYTGL